MLNVIVFGAPGSGKGTQSEKLIEEYNLHHISTGELLRDHIARGTELGKLANTYISNGLLIPDELMIEVLDEIFKNDPAKVAQGVIFDGFPRTVAQAEALSEMLKEYCSEIHAVVGLEVEEDELIRRMLERGKQSGRSDDNLETIKKRLNVYHRRQRHCRRHFRPHKKSARRSSR